MKACKTCRTVKPLSDFYKLKKMADGHASNCKECYKESVRRYRSENTKRVREYDRQRGYDPRRKEAVKRRAHRYRGKYAPLKATHPEMRAAHIAVGNAIRDGKLKVQPCERCGYAVGVQAHHEDYSKPLDVTWLCRPCHGLRHREINEERRQRTA